MKTKSMNQEIKEVQETIIENDLILAEDASYQGNLVVKGSISGTYGSRYNLKVDGDLRVYGSVSVSELRVTGNICSDAVISARSISSLDLSACSISAKSMQVRDIIACKINSSSITAHSISRNIECAHADKKEQLLISLKRNQILS
jgi:hypothetical protein